MFGDKIMYDHKNGGYQKWHEYHQHRKKAQQIQQQRQDDIQRKGVHQYHQVSSADIRQAQQTAGMIAGIISAIVIAICAIIRQTFSVVHTRQLKNIEQDERNKAWYMEYGQHLEFLKYKQVKRMMNLEEIISIANTTKVLANDKTPSLSLMIAMREYFNCRKSNNELLDVARYIEGRQMALEALKFHMQNLVQAYTKAAVYVCGKGDFDSYGCTDMYYHSELGREVHKEFFELAGFGVGFSPFHYAKPSFDRYGTEIKKAFEFAGVCENLKIALEAGVVKWNPPGARGFFSALGYQKDGLAYDSADIHQEMLSAYTNTLILDMYECLESTGQLSKEMIEEIHHPSLNGSLNDLLVITHAYKLFSDTSNICLGKKNILKIFVNNGIYGYDDTVYDVFLRSANLLQQIRELTALVRALSRFLNHYIDGTLQFYLAKMIVLEKQRLFEQATPYSGFVKKILVGDACFYQNGGDIDRSVYELNADDTAEYLKDIANFDKKAEMLFMQAIKEQAQGISTKPIYVRETDSYEVALEPTLGKDGNMVLNIDFGKTKIDEENRIFEKNRATILAYIKEHSH